MEKSEKSLLGNVHIADYHAVIEIHWTDQGHHPSTNPIWRSFVYKSSLHFVS